MGQKAMKIDNVIGTMTGGKGSATVTQICPKYVGFRVTDAPLYYNVINCNSKSILLRCVRFVPYSVKSNFYVIGVSGCVSVSHWFREEVKICKKPFRNNLLCKFSEQTITIRLSWCKNTRLQAIQITIFHPRTIQLH